MRSPSDTLTDLACQAQQLPEPDRLVTQHLILAAAASGFERAAHLTDWLRDMSQSQRRTVLDNAREACGLPRSDGLDRAEANALRNR